VQWVVGRGGESVSFVVLRGHSRKGFTAPNVCKRL